MIINYYKMNYDNTILAGFILKFSIIIFGFVLVWWGRSEKINVGKDANQEVALHGGASSFSLKLNNFTKSTLLIISGLIIIGFGIFKSMDFKRRVVQENTNQSDNKAQPEYVIDSIESVRINIEDSFKLVGTYKKEHKYFNALTLSFFIRGYVSDKSIFSKLKNENEKVINELLLRFNYKDQPKNISNYSEKTEEVHINDETKDTIK